MNVNVLYDDRQDNMEINAEHIEWIELVVRTCLKFENMDGNFEVSVSFVTNDEIKELNKMFRNVNSETDVLSFPMDETEGDIIMLGDIVLSTEKIIEQAEEYRHTIDREMYYLVCHSTLHLLGYDHMTDEDQMLMRQKEKEVMKELKIFK